MKVHICICLVPPLFYGTSAILVAHTIPHEAFLISTRLDSSKARVQENLVSVLSASSLLTVGEKIERTGWR